MRSKVIESAASAVSAVASEGVVLVGGWGGVGVPERLIEALAARGDLEELTLVTNNCGMGRPGDVGMLFAAGMVSRVITTYPTNPDALEFREQFDAGRLQVEVTPQGTLAERLRAAGAGIGGFYTPTGVGTPIAEGRETRVLEGRPQLFETALRGDVALIKADIADAAGNVRFHLVSRSFSPLMAMAARRTIVQADRLVPIGQIAPDDVHLPGIFVDQVLAPEQGRGGQQ